MHLHDAPGYEPDVPVRLSAQEILANAYELTYVKGDTGMRFVTLRSQGGCRPLASRCSKATDVKSSICTASNQSPSCIHSLLFPPPLHNTGSSTVCVAVLNGTSLQTSNLGDSGLLVVRGDQVVMATAQQQHSFNFPFQVSSAVHAFVLLAHL